MQAALVERRFGFLIGLTTAIGTAAVLFVGAGQVVSGLLTLGELLLVMSYLSQLYEPLKTISRRTASLQSQLASAERAFALLEEPPDVVERPDARPLRRARGAVTFRDVLFAYDRERPVLRKLSFEIGPGQRVGIVGATGAGKTTIVSLLARFHDPTDGQILLDGVDLRDYKVADLRNQFSIVLQEPVLFSTSIGENIAYARPGATEREIEMAADAANIHEFITSLRERYDTVVGERGLRLSGGERQRVSLARAFLKDAPILILDEPTSSVDLTTEAAIMDALERLMKGRTTITITHRLTLLKGCDVALRVHEGTIAEATSLARPGFSEVVGGRTM
jgi:ATP-binding cassette, subfamily B, bacterial